MAVGDKNFVLQRRQQSLDELRLQSEEKKKDAVAAFSNIGRLAVASQMQLEEVKRKTIEARKEAELKEQRHNLQSWQNSLLPKVDIQQKGGLIDNEMCEKVCDTLTRENIAMKNRGATIAHTEDVIQENDKLDHSVIVNHNWLPTKDDETHYKNILKNGTDGDAEAEAEYTEVSAKYAKPLVKQAKELPIADKILPATRKTISIPVSFTPKTLPAHLPARESRERIQLKEKKQVPNDTIDVSEREPIFLQDKGDKFYVAGDYRSAVNAYTTAISKDPSLVLSYTNRAACNLQLQELKGCIEDCTTALKLLKFSENDAQGDWESLTSNYQPLEKEMLNAETRSHYIPAGSLTLSTSFIHQEHGNSGCEMVCELAKNEWEKSVQTHVLSRRAIARIFGGDVWGATSDLQKALAFQPGNKEIQRVLQNIEGDMLTKH